MSALNSCPRLTARHALALVGFLLTALPPSRAGAGAFRYLDVAELARRSDAAVIARVASARVGWNEDGTIIVTTFTLEPSEILAGSPARGPLELTRVGGEIDGLALGHDAMPELEVGETIAAFLLERDGGGFIVSGLSQGILHERDGSFQRDLSGVAAAPSTMERLTGEELRSRVAAALRHPESRTDREERR